MNYTDDSQMSKFASILEAQKIDIPKGRLLGSFLVFKQLEEMRTLLMELVLTETEPSTIYQISLFTAQPE